jgi:hypothetical protein
MFNWQRGLGASLFVFMAALTFSSIDLWDVKASTADEERKSGGKQEKEPEIATDPSFREVKGALIEGMPAFPAYPDSKLIGSAERNRPNEKNRGYRIKWTTTDSPDEVMAWYQKTLVELGWKYVPPAQEEDEDELIAKISKGEFDGYIESEFEDEDDTTEIIVVLARK